MNVVTEAGVQGFLFDPNRCTGCNACELACSTENELGWGRSWRHVVDFNPERLPGVPGFHLSLACNHCDDAPCMQQCPALAIRRDPATGAVLIDDSACIGCGYCSWVCPYDAPRYDEDRRVMGKCTSCQHRMIDGGGPACAEACPTGALGFGALDGEVMLPGFPDTAAGPRIRFQALREDARPVETTWTLPEEVLESFNSARPERSRIISFRGELPLWLFTLAVAALVGRVLGSALTAIPIPRLSFVTIAAAAMAVSTLHLGQRHRAWRALANLRRSRLSREIAAFSLFLVSAAPVLFWLATPSGWVWVSAGLGMVTLFAVDRVYDPVRPQGARLHSADVILTGPLLATMMLTSVPALAFPAAAKLGLYVWRWLSGRRAVRGGLGIAIALLRVAGLMVPLVLSWSRMSFGAWALALVWISESVDRAEFYEELRVATPRDQARRDAAAWTTRPPRPSPGSQRFFSHSP